MSLLTDIQRAQLLTNGDKTAREGEHDPAPVVKLLTLDGRASWLLSELDPTDPDRAFGLCDLGQGFPELGYVRLSELETLGLSLIADAGYTPAMSLTEYAELARSIGRIWT